MGAGRRCARPGALRPRWRCPDASVRARQCWRTRASLPAARMLYSSRRPSSPITSTQLDLAQLELQAVARTAGSAAGAALAEGMAGTAPARPSAAGRRMRRRGCGLIRRTGSRFGCAGSTASVCAAADAADPVGAPAAAVVAVGVTSRLAMRQVALQPAVRGQPHGRSQDESGQQHVYRRDRIALVEVTRVRHRPGSHQRRRSTCGAASHAMKSCPADRADAHSSWVTAQIDAVLDARMVVGFDRLQALRQAQLPRQPAPGPCRRPRARCAGAAPAGRSRRSLPALGGITSRSVTAVGPRHTDRNEPRPARRAGACRRRCCRNLVGWHSSLAGRWRTAGFRCSGVGAAASAAGAAALAPRSERTHPVCPFRRRFMTGLPRNPATGLAGVGELLAQAGGVLTRPSALPSLKPRCRARRQGFRACPALRLEALQRRHVP